MPSVPASHYDILLTLCIINPGPTYQATLTIAPRPYSLNPKPSCLNPQHETAAIKFLLLEQVELPGADAKDFKGLC